MAQPAQTRTERVISAEQIQKRVRELARQISSYYRGKTFHALGILENGFMTLKYA
jgi:hypoxanthine-guanine phosphoribosyltransferase